MSSSRGSSQPRGRTCVCYIAGRLFPTEPPGKASICLSRVYRRRLPTYGFPLDFPQVRAWSRGCGEVRVRGSHVSGRGYFEKQHSHWGRHHRRLGSDDSGEGATPHTYTSPLPAVFWSLEVHKEVAVMLHSPAGWGASSGPVPAQPTPGAPRTAGLTRQAWAGPHQGPRRQARTPRAEPSLPGLPLGQLALFSLELCRAALPRTAPPSETKGPVRLSLDPTRGPCAWTGTPSLRGAQTSRAREPGHRGQAEGCTPHHRAGSSGPGARSPASRQKELEGPWQDGAGYSSWSLGPLGAAWCMDEMKEEGRSSPG